MEMVNGVSVIVADADFVESATLVAVTVIVCWVGIVGGVVYRPFALTLPAAAGVTLQVTEVFEEPETVSLNCCVWPEYRFALDGLMETPTDCGDSDANRFTRIPCLRGHRCESGHKIDGKAQVFRGELSSSFHVGEPMLSQKQSYVNSIDH